MVERCNGRIEEIPRQTRFASANELATTIEHCAKLADARTPQTMSGHRTPLDTLRAWRKGSDLFVQNIYNLAESDT
ncbi:MAG TPA: hypothetical protein DEB17_03665 [Chlorobaculum sp.]|nr:hypothetical protein [Chlorobaculum sp.]